MKAWVATSLTGEAGLELRELPEPECGPGRVRIAIHAVSLNYPDTLITRGKYQLQAEPPFVPGSEAAGVIVEVGPGVTGLTVGDRVLTIGGLGAFADQIVVDPAAQQVHVIPDEMSFEEAAGFGMVYGTAMHALRQRGQIQPGETVLVLGAAGGCGSAAVAVASMMGARVIAAASSAQKCAFAQGFGATETVNYGKHDLREQVMTVTGGDGVDVLFDPVGGALFEQARRCLAWNGRYLVIGFAAGGIPVMPANYALIKSISMIGVAFGMSAVRDPQMNHANFATLFGWYRQGRLPVAPSSIIAFDEIPDACAQMYSGGGVGKTVVRVER